MTEILALSNIKCIGLPGSKSPSVYEWTSFFHSDMSPPLPKNAKFCLICDLALKSEILNKLGEQRWLSYVLPEFSTVLPRPPWEPSSGLPRHPWEPSCNIPVCKFVFLTCYKTLNYFTHTHTHTGLQERNVTTWDYASCCKNSVGQTAKSNAKLSWYRLINDSFVEAVCMLSE